MRRAWAVAVIVGVAGVVLGTGRAAAAAEPTPEAVAAAIAERGWYADPEAVGDREQLGQVAARLAQGGDAMGFALLAAEPTGSSPAFAERVLDALPSQTASTPIRTIVVLSNADVGVVSDQWSDSAIDAALDDTIDDLRANPTDGLEALADALADQPSGFSDDDDGTSDDGGGMSGGWIALLVIVGVVAIGSGYVRRFLNGDDVFAGDDDNDDSWSSSWSNRRRRSSSFFSSSRSSHRSSSSSRRSSSSGHRGRGGRRL